MTIEVVGRDEQLVSLRWFFDAADRDGPRAIALEGPAGIGKSTLWRTAVDVARERGLRVLSSRPLESEQGLAYAGLGDLFEAVLPEVRPRLTAPQQRALDVALLVEEAEGEAVDALALGVAVRSVLQELARDELLLAIDDLQWLDPASASAIGFALRRLPGASVLVLWARRTGERTQPSPVEEAFDRERVEHVAVGPLSVGALQQVLRARLARAVPRPSLLRLHEVSGGNPFYAIELARALAAAKDGAGDPTLPLPVPEQLEELIAARVDGFGADTREALVLAAAQPRLTLDELAAAGVHAGVLDPALDDGVIELERTTVRFSHPLLGSVLYQRLPPSERYRAHARLAELVADPIARARHLALSTDTPDALLARALERAAATAEAQGAPSIAAELGEHAIRLTPAGRRADQDRRKTLTARVHLAAGDAARARALARELLARAPAGARRAEALALLGEIELEELRRSIPLFEEALREPGAPAALCAYVHLRLGLILRFTAGLKPAERHARAAVDLAAEVGDDTLLAQALAGLALIRFNNGKRDGLPLAERAYALAQAAGPVAPNDVVFSLVHILVWSVQLERARTLLEATLRDWSDRDERIAANALWYLSLVELLAARLAPAAGYAERARDLNVQYARHDAGSPQTYFPLGLVAAYQGDLRSARASAERAIGLAELHSVKLSVPHTLLGLVEHWSGDAEAAVARFADAEAIPNAPDRIEPAMQWWRADQVEALLELGRVDDAVVRLDAWEAGARRLGRDWVLAHAMRCRGLVAAATGDVGAAQAALDDAVTRHEAAGDPFGRARTLLALGAVHRRQRQKRAARDAIEGARAGFAEIGAQGWAARAERELGTIGGRTRAEGLTAAERRVANLVVRGHTNAEVATTLFLSERTVASHLTRVYAKLGVRSRTELARRLG